MERIQPDFSIKLNDVQLLKKFHTPDFDRIFSDLRIFHDTMFVINLSEDNIFVSPYKDERGLETFNYNY